MENVAAETKPVHVKVLEAQGLATEMWSVFGEQIPACQDATPSVFLNLICELGLRCVYALCLCFDTSMQYITFVCILQMLRISDTK